jgi:hypothetical protein
MLDVKDLNAQHLAWARDETILTQLNFGTVKIESPFVASFHDGLVMYATKMADSNTIELTDDGWTNDNLESHGLYLNRSPKRRHDLLNQLHAYGVVWKDEELTITGNKDDFGRLKNQLLQAMIFANDMFILASK